MGSSSDIDLISWSQCHPVLSTFIPRSVLPIPAESLSKFVEYYAENGGLAGVPATFTEFYRRYISFKVSQYNECIRDWNQAQHLANRNVNETLDALGKLAFRHMVKGKQLTAADVQKGLRLPQSSGVGQSLI